MRADGVCHEVFPNTTHALATKIGAVVDTSFDTNALHTKEGDATHNRYEHLHSRLWAAESAKSSCCS